MRIDCPEKPDTVRMEFQKRAVKIPGKGMIHSDMTEAMLFQTVTADNTATSILLYGNPGEKWMMDTWTGTRNSPKKTAYPKKAMS